MTRRELLARFCVFGSARAVVATGAARLAAEPPARIVSVVPSATEILFAIGAGSRVVGVGSYDRYPPEAARLPKLGGLLDPNVERLFALQPDLAIVYGTQAELKRELERAGIPMFLYVHRGLPDIITTIRELGTRIGAGAAASALATRIESQLSAIRSRVAGRPRPTTLLVLGREPGTLRNLYASGGVGFLHDLLELAGGADVLGDVKRESVDVGTETLLSRAPEVIVELHYGSELKPDRLDSERRVWDRLRSVPAVNARRVYFLVGDEFVVPGPRIAAAAERLARTLHPEAW